MARGSVALSRIGLGAGACVALLALGPLAAVALRAEGAQGLGPADWAALRFTVVQAILSAVISTALAIPVARALARRRFPGRSALITIMGAPFLLPVIVAILGILAVFGRNGLMNDAITALGLPRLNIYGLQGVVLAHVFFNLPLAVRLILQGWLSVPAERFRLAAALSMPPGTVARVIEWPMLRRVVPGAMLVIWLVCMTSFAVALTLGGGPRATTIELAIYQAIRFDFDLGHGAMLALVQVALCVAVGLGAWRAAPMVRIGGGLDRPVERWDRPAGVYRVMDALWIAMAGVFLILPLAAILVNGLAGMSQLTAATGYAAGRSLAVALGSCAVATGLAVAVSLRGGAMFAVVTALPLAVSSLVLGTGMFLLCRMVVSPTAVALPVTALVNAMLVLPFALRAIRPVVEDTQASHGRLAASLGMSPWVWFRWGIWPRLRRPVGFSAGIAAAFSMGDLGVIALFATQGQETLPLHMYGLMGAYRMDAAAAAGLVLVALTLGVFWIFDRGGRADAAV